jgi:hypothetical protein
VQPKAVPVFLGGETVGENPSEAFRRQSDSGILHFDPSPHAGRMPDADVHHPIGRIRLLDRLFGILQKVEQNLQNVVFVRRDRRQFLVFAFDPDAVPLKPACAMRKASSANCASEMSSISSGNSWRSSVGWRRSA